MPQRSSKSSRCERENPYEDLSFFEALERKEAREMNFCNFSSAAGETLSVMRSYSPGCYDHGRLFALLL
jgi:hypothetical protein